MALGAQNTESYYFGDPFMKKLHVRYMINYSDCWLLLLMKRHRKLIAI